MGEDEEGLEAAGEALYWLAVSVIRSVNQPRRISLTSMATLGAVGRLGPQRITAPARLLPAQDAEALAAAVPALLRLRALQEQGEGPRRGGGKGQSPDPGRQPNRRAAGDEGAAAATRRRHRPPRPPSGRTRGQVARAQRTAHVANAAHAHAGERACRKRSEST